MPEERLVLDLVLAVAAAFAGGLVAQRLGQPVIVGFLVAGMAIGPATPGPTADVGSVRLLAEIGVAFLMFALGAEFSRTELGRLGRIAVFGGTLQIVGTMALGPLLAPWLGISTPQGLFVGGVLALSSTVVALKVLMARGELQALHGRVALGLLIAQDVAVVALVIALPPLAAGGEGRLPELAEAAVKAAAVVTGAYLLGVRVVPWLLGHVALPRSREVFLLGVVALALGTATVTALVGLSLAFGAFVAGLVVAESEYRTQVIAEVLPLRDLFTSLFFVSVGMLVDPLAIVSDVGVVAALTGVVVVAKSAIVAAVVLLLGMPARVAILAGLALGQIGEFSFVLAQLGADVGAMPKRLFDATLAVSVASIVLSPFLLRAAPSLLAALRSLPVIGMRFADPVETDDSAGALRQHTVICGFGRVGRGLAEALVARRLRYLVVEYNPQVVRELRARGAAVVYGDAGNPEVLGHAHLESATLLAVLVPDAAAAERATRYARSLYPRLDIVARAMTPEDVERLRRAGATDVVQPEFEAGVELIRHALRRYGIGGIELQNIAAGRRAAFYRRAESTEE